MDEANEKSHPMQTHTELLSALLSNPDSLSKLSAILSKFTSEENGTVSPPKSNLDKIMDNAQDNHDQNIDDIENISPTEPTKSTIDSSMDFSKIITILSTISHPQKPQNNRQIALLLAIKPYLSARRKDLIDSFIQITNFSEIFKNFSQKGGSDVL